MLRPDDAGPGEPFRIELELAFAQRVDRHPLQHEALPAKDFKRIRANGAELVKRGQAIVQVGVPKGTSDNHVKEFRRELKKFEGALNKFSDHSQSGSDDQLEVSFTALHDSFELLAGMLPRK